VWKFVSVGNPTIRKKWLEFISQHKKNNAFAIFNQFIVSALTHCVSTTLKLIGYRSQPPAAAPDPQLFSEIQSSLQKLTQEKIQKKNL
jgi:hypothetical protein